MSFVHDLEARRLTIRFASNEEPVVINTRTGLPVSGSERTAPHLHLWQQIAGRPFSDSYKEVIEQNEGTDETRRLRMTTLPVVVKGVVTRDVGQASSVGGMHPRKASGLAEGKNRSHPSGDP